MVRTKRETSVIPDPAAVPEAVRPELMNIFVNATLAVTGFTENMPLTVYHYCDAHALTNIIEKQSLWATDLSYCNDAQEVVLGRKTLSTACASLSRVSNDSTQKEVLDAFNVWLSQQQKFHSYGCCFSKKGDQLGQWRGYADGGKGYSIGFSTFGLLEALGSGNLLPVVYQNTKQKKLCEDPLRAIMPRLATHIVSGTMPLGGALAVLVAFSPLITLGIKHRGFVEEAEVRYALQWSPDEVNVLPINFRARGGLLVPFLPLTSKEGIRFTIDEIILGPGLDYEKAGHSLRQFLDKHSYQGTKVRPSDIPYLP